MKIFAYGVIFPAMAGLLIVVGACGSSKIGMQNNRLMPCPDSPNCVSSFETDPSHFVEPIRYKGSRTDAHQKLLSILHAAKRVKVVTSEENYIHAEFTSLIFRFVDDVEFYMDEKEPLIHVRSASRVGYSDLGANRKRAEAIRMKLIE
ncbi:MAG: DUF1499 domain-containing protein [Desulfosalsimonadaceae bacterium]